MSFSLVPGFAQRYPKDDDGGPSWRDSILIESCCTTLDEALAALSRGADRIELCTGLSRGGLTPPRDLISEVVNSLTIPVNVLIRPQNAERSGRYMAQGAFFSSRSHIPERSEAFLETDFVYDESDLDQMVDDIEYCKTAGAAGIVVGALAPDGGIDVPSMRRLIAAAAPLPVTFHRAFDVAAGDPFDDLETIISLGCARLLTSGRAATAWDGRGLLSQLVRHAGDRLVVMPGCGVTPANLPLLHAFIRASEYHGTKLP